MSENLIKVNYKMSYSTATTSNVEESYCMSYVIYFYTLYGYDSSEILFCEALVHGI